MGHSQEEDALAAAALEKVLASMPDLFDDVAMARCATTADDGATPCKLLSCLL